MQILNDSAAARFDERTESGQQAGPTVGTKTVVLILSALCLLIALARLHTYHEPSDRDMGMYAVIVHEVLHGGRLYEGALIDNKPPAIYFIYGVAEWIAGYGRGQIYLMGVGAALATLLGCYWAGKIIGGSRGTGLWAAAFWTVACGDLWLEANQPNSEVFINAFTVFGLVFLLGGGRKLIPWRRAALAGVCFASASLFKHVAAVIPIFTGLACIAFPPPGRNRRGIVMDMVMIGLVGVLAWAAVFAYFTATGRSDGFIDCVIRYNQSYAGSMGANLIHGMKPLRLFPPVLYCMIPLGLMAGGGLVAGWWRREFFPWAAMGGLAVGTAVAVALPGRFYPHYYQLWLPFLVLGSAATAGFIGKNFKRLPLAGLLAPAVLAVLVANELPPYFYPATEWSCEKYGADFVGTDKLARSIRASLKPGETFYQLGEEPQLYFDTGMRPVSTLCVYFTFMGPMAPRLSERTLSDLSGHPPDLLVVGRKSLSITPGRFLEWIRANYTLSPPERGQSFFLCVKKGSPLEKRSMLQGR